VIIEAGKVPASYFYTVLCRRFIGKISRFVDLLLLYTRSLLYLCNKNNHLICKFMENNCNYRNRRFGGGAFIAIMLILAGTLFILFDAGVIPLIYKPVVFSWQMLVIMLGVYFLLRRSMWGIALIGVGVLFLLKIIPGYNFELYLPHILILAGIAILVKLLFFRSKGKTTASRFHYAETAADNGGRHDAKSSKSTEHTSSDRIEKSVAFSSSEQIVFSQDFQGGEANVIFGEIKIDLRKSVLSNDNYLEANVCFGNIELFVPTDWKINIKSESFFGVISDSRRQLEQESGDGRPVLNLKGAACFGNIEVRN
jgi:predicted membrane protein